MGIVFTLISNMIMSQGMQKNIGIHDSQTLIRILSQLRPLNVKGEDAIFICPTSDIKCYLSCVECGVL